MKYLAKYVNNYDMIKMVIDMKLKIIGSGSMWTGYNSASYMIDDNILVDMPNGMCKNLFRVKLDPRNIEHVLITHFHGDHYFDMPFYLLLKSRADNKNVNIYCGKEGKRKNKALLKMAFPNSCKDVLKSVSPNYNHDEHFTIKDYDIKRCLVDHGRMKPAYGYIIKTKSSTVSFTGDSCLCAEVEHMASISDYLILDCMFLKGTTKHMGIDNIKYLLDKYPKCQYIVTHLEDETRKELKKQSLKNVIIPEDGEEIEIV